jgi:pimeloyl-ACP methyl ester carboxylesterase
MRLLPRAALAAALLVPGVAAAQVAPIAGDWYGTLDGKLPVVFHIKADGTATLDSPAQNALGLKASVVAIGGKVRLTLAALPIAFEGTASADGKMLEGQLTQNGGSAPLIMSRTPPAPAAAPAAAPIRPQTPKPPFPYRAEDVTYANPATGLKLAGTLTLPKGAGPFPAVLLITGSGAQDRDETIYGHKPFLLIADALTRKGLAVLRVDDRGMGGSVAFPGSPTLDDDAHDVAASLAWLRARPEIDKARVGLLGHSEGGMLAIRIAADDPKLAFVVLMSTPGGTGASLVVEQVGAILKASGAGEAQVQAATKAQGELLAIVASPQDPATALPAMNAVFDRQGLPADAATRKQLPVMLSAHYRSVIRFDPMPYLARIKTPVLAIGGSKDLQVPAAANLAAIKAGLPASTEATTQQLPGLNHLLQTAGTGLPSEYGKIEETLAPAALAAIVDWTVAHTVRTK